MDITGLYYYGARYYDPQRSFWMSVDPLVEITMSPYAYTWNDPVNYADPTGMIGERIGGPRGIDPNKIYNGGTIEEVVIRGRKKPNAVHTFLRMSQDLDRGINDGVMDYTKDAYNFVTKNAYSKLYWQEKGGEALMSAVFIADMSKIRPDGSSNAIDLFNRISNASAYDVGHFTGYNGVQFATTAVLTEGSELLLNSIRISSKVRNFNFKPSLNSQVAAEAQAQGFKSLNTGINRAIVDKYLQMLTNKFEPVGVGGFKWEGKFYFNEGNHKMNAAIRYKIMTGSFKYMDELMKNAKFDIANPAAYGRI